MRGVCLECAGEAGFRRRHGGRRSRSAVADERRDNEFPLGKGGRMVVNHALQVGGRAFHGRLQRRGHMGAVVLPMLADRLQVADAGVHAALSLRDDSPRCSAWALTAAAMPSSAAETVRRVCSTWSPRLADKVEPWSASQVQLQRKS